MEGKLATKNKNVAWDADPNAGIVPRWASISKLPQVLSDMQLSAPRALGQMFDKLNSEEQREGAESVVKVSK